MGESADNKVKSRARAAEPDPVVLQHEHLRSITERVRIAWSSDEREGDTGRRAKRKLRDKAREFADLALATLVELCTDVSNPAQRLGAAKELLDRGFGKSVEHLEVDDRRDTEAAAMVAELAQLRKNPDTAAALLSLAEASAKLGTKARD